MPKTSFNSQHEKQLKRTQLHRAHQLLKQYQQDCLPEGKQYPQSIETIALAQPLIPEGEAASYTLANRPRRYPTSASSSQIITTLALLTLIATPTFGGLVARAMSTDEIAESALSLDLMKSLNQKISEEKASPSAFNVEPLLSLVNNRISASLVDIDNPVIYTYSEQDLSIIRSLASRYLVGEGVRKDLLFAKNLFEFCATRHDKIAQYQLGHLMFKIPSIPIEAGIAWLIESAKNGLVIAQAEVGELLTKSDHSIKPGEKQIKDGIAWLEKAASASNPKAIITLGDLYLKGEHITKDEKKAAHFFQQAMQKSEGDWHRVASIKYAKLLLSDKDDPEKLEKAAEILYAICKERCDFKVPEMVVQLAYHFIKPTADSLLGDKARRLLLIAAENNNLHALEKLNDDLKMTREVYLRNHEQQHFRDLYTQRLTAVADAYTKMGDNALRDYFESGNKDEGFHQLALASYQSARDLLRHSANINRFIYHLCKLPPDKGDDASSLMIKIVIKAGVKNAFQTVREMFRDTDLPPGQANLFSSAISKNDLFTVADIAYEHHLKYPLLKPLLFAAIEAEFVPLGMLKPAAEKEDKDAMYSLAIRYGAPFYSQSDLAISQRWLEQAAEQGHANALHELAISTVEKQGIGNPMVYYWMREAARKGNAKAIKSLPTIEKYKKPDEYYAQYEFEIGKKYVEGNGVPKNEVLGWEWIEKSFQHQNPHAKAYRDKHSYLSSTRALSSFYYPLLLTMAMVIAGGAYLLSLTKLRMQFNKLWLAYSAHNSNKLESKLEAPKALSLIAQAFTLTHPGWNVVGSEFVFRCYLGKDIQLNIPIIDCLEKHDNHIPSFSIIKPQSFILTQAQLRLILDAAISKAVPALPLTYQITNDDQLILSLPSDFSLNNEQAKSFYKRIKENGEKIYVTLPAFQDYFSQIFEYRRKEEIDKVNIFKNSIQSLITKYQNEYDKCKQAATSYQVNVDDYLHSHGPIGKKANELYNSCNKLNKVHAHDYFNQLLQGIDCNENEAIAKLNDVKKLLDQQLMQLQEWQNIWKVQYEGFINIKHHQRESASPAPERNASPSESIPAKKGKEKQSHSVHKPVHETHLSSSSTSTSSSMGTSTTAITIKKPANSSVSFFDNTTAPLFTYQKDPGPTKPAEPAVKMGPYASNLWNMVQHIAINLRNAGNVLADPEVIDEDKEVAIHEIVDGLPLLYQHLSDCSQDSNIAAAINLPVLATIRHAIRHKMHCFLYAGEKDMNRTMLISFCNQLHKQLISPFQKDASLTSTYSSQHLINLYSASRTLLATHANTELSSHQKSEAISYELDFIRIMAKRLASNYVYSSTSMRKNAAPVEMQKDRFYRAICGAADAIGELSPPTDTSFLRKLLDHTLDFADLNEEHLPALCREIRNLRGHEINPELSALIANNKEAYLDLFSPSFILQFATWASKQTASLTNEQTNISHHALRT